MNPTQNLHVNVGDSPMNINKLHHRLGHLNFQTPQEIISKGAISELEIDTKLTDKFCTSCVQGKASQHPFPHESQTKFTKYREKIVTDIWGPSKVTSLRGHNYCQFYHDMATGEDWADFLKSKAEALERYQQYQKWVKIQQNADIICLGKDYSGEYLSNEFTKILKNDGTVCHLIVHDSPLSNGAAERSHCTHIEWAQSMSIGSGLGRRLWAEAVHHSVWIGNQVPSCASSEFIAPIAKATSQKPDLKGILEWGTVIWVKDLHAGNLDPRAKKGWFIGYDKEFKGYHIYWPGKNKVSVKRNVYADQRSVIDPGNFNIDGEWETVEKPDNSNPTIPNQINQ